jgi:hypothetical protein
MTFIGAKTIMVAVNGAWTNQQISSFDGVGRHNSERSIQS